MDLAAANPEKKKDIHGSARLGRLLGILVFFCAFFTISFSLVYLAVFLGNLSISSPISLPSQCKIVSSSVDLRSSKVCELGLLNYKAKHVLYPSERKKFRCHYDYYWASVFKVEYMDHSGQARLALAEAPNEALPSDCRPNFSGAWLTKDKFEVNKTYECWYTLGISKVHIYQDGFFDCQAKDPSTIEMFIRYLILSFAPAGNIAHLVPLMHKKVVPDLFVQKLRSNGGIKGKQPLYPKGRGKVCVHPTLPRLHLWNYTGFMRILKSWYVSGLSYFRWRWEAVAGVIAGFCTSIISVIFLGLLRRLFSCIYQLSVARRLTLPLNKVRLRRVCVLLAYVSFTSWLAVQYFRRIGLPEIAVYYSM